jgi:hypothetical protein
MPMSAIASIPANYRRENGEYALLSAVWQTSAVAACRERSIGGEKPTYRYPTSTKLDNSKIDNSESASPVILDTPAQTKAF